MMKIKIFLLSLCGIFSASLSAMKGPIDYSDQINQMAKKSYDVSRLGYGANNEQISAFIKKYIKRHMPLWKRDTWHCDTIQQCHNADNTFYSIVQDFGGEFFYQEKENEVKLISLGICNKLSFMLTHSKKTLWTVEQSFSYPYLKTGNDLEDNPLPKWDPNFFQKIFQKKKTSQQLKRVADAFSQKEYSFFQDRGLSFFIKYFRQKWPAKSLFIHTPFSQENHMTYAHLQIQQQGRCRISIADPGSYPQNSYGIISSLISKQIACIKEIKEKSLSFFENMATDCQLSIDSFEHDYIGHQSRNLSDCGRFSIIYLFNHVFKGKKPSDLCPYEIYCGLKELARERFDNRLSHYLKHLCFLPMKLVYDNLKKEDLNEIKEFYLPLKDSIEYKLTHQEVDRFFEKQNLPLFLMSGKEIEGKKGTGWQRFCDAVFCQKRMKRGSSKF